MNASRLVKMNIATGEISKIRETGHFGHVMGADLAEARSGAQGFAYDGRKQPVPGNRDPQAAQHLGTVAVAGSRPSPVRHASAQR